MRRYTVKYLDVDTSMCGLYEEYSYAGFLSKRTEIISQIVGVVKRGGGCDKLVEAFEPLIINERLLNLSHELELREDEDAVECPYAVDEAAGEYISRETVWIRNFNVNALFDVDAATFGNVSGCLSTFGWSRDETPANIVLGSVRDGTWTRFRRWELYHAVCQTIQAFYLDNEKTQNDVFTLIERLHPFHRLMYFGDTMEKAGQIAKRCNIPFDDFVTITDLKDDDSDTWIS